jgi:hypothetical protein
MKKTYIAPAVEVLNIETVEMMAASAIGINRTGSGSQQLGNERDERQWGNIWE